jgi:hypothetical protein
MILAPLMATAPSIMVGVVAVPRQSWPGQQRDSHDDAQQERSYFLLHILTSLPSRAQGENSSGCTREIALVSAILASYRQLARFSTCPASTCPGRSYDGARRPFRRTVLPAM